MIGGNGCGKTRFSKKLAAGLGLPLVHLDALYWGDHWQPVAGELFESRLMQALQQPRWVIDGNIARTLPLRLRYCDTVIWLDYSRLCCLWGAVRRFLGSYGKSRPDMGGYCPEKLTRDKLEFFKSIWVSHPATRRRFAALLGRAGDGVRIIVLENRRQAARLLQGL